MSDEKPWREEMRRMYETQIHEGRQAEFILRSHALPEGFRVSPYSGGLVFQKYGSQFEGETSLAAFHRLVMETTAALGVAPKRISGGASWGSRQADLRAYWPVEGCFGSEISVSLSIMAARDCKLDPRHPGYNSRPGQLHPECQSVLEQMEEELADLVEEGVS
jgi:hypothetical protein